MGQKSQRMAFSDRLTAGADQQLLVQVFQVGFDRGGSNAQLIRDLFVLLAPNTVRGSWLEPPDFIENENGH
jgi:hypothetical protein